jgi:hypothetical protein
MAKEDIRKVRDKEETEAAYQASVMSLKLSYYNYLRSRAMRMEKEQPDTYRAFLAKEVEERIEIEKNNSLNSHSKEQLLRDFNSEEAHLNRLSIFFREPTLDDWLNPSFIES